jgi:hypothetical protein
MTRIGTLISALILLVFASPSHALTYQYSFDGVVGFISGLEDNSFNQPADSVTVTASPIGGLGEYAPGAINDFTVLNGVIFSANFASVNFGNLLVLSPPVGLLLVDENTENTIVANLSFSQTPLPAALPLFATGLGALGLLGWRRKRKQAA